MLLILISMRPLMWSSIFLRGEESYAVPICNRSARVLKCCYKLQIWHPSRASILPENRRHPGNVWKPLVCRNRMAFTRKQLENFRSLRRNVDFVQLGGGHRKGNLLSLWNTLYLQVARSLCQNAYPEQRRLQAKTHQGDIEQLECRLR